MDDELLKRAHKWAASRHTRIRSLGVCRTTTEGRYILAECASLEEAREVARRSGRDGLCRNPTIVALTPEGWVFELEKIEL